MKNLDKDSKEFINWCQAELSKKAKRDILAEYFFDIIDLVREDKDFLKRIKEKQIKGAKEHGPINPDRDYLKEIDDEVLDLFGWKLMEIWVNKFK